MKDFNFKNISIGLNYGTADTDNEDVIFIETAGKHNGDGAIIAVTAEEAEMIAIKLIEFVSLFKEKSDSKETLPKKVPCFFCAGLSANCRACKGKGRVSLYVCRDAESE